MTPRLTFEDIPEMYADGYTGKACSGDRHGDCPGGFGVRVGYLCGGPGAGPIVSTRTGTPCACSCHDEPTE